MSLEEDRLECLRLRNAQLRLMLVQRDALILQLQHQLANCQQTAIAALAKAEQLEQGR